MTKLESELAKVMVSVAPRLLFPTNVPKDDPEQQKRAKRQKVLDSIEAKLSQEQSNIEVKNGSG